MHRLPRIIAQKQALGMILTGRRVSAKEGRELGFVNEVVPVGEALAGAKRWAQMILECSPMAVRASKEAIYRGMDESSLEVAIKTVYPAQQANLESQDYIERGRKRLPKSASPTGRIDNARPCRHLTAARFRDPPRVPAPRSRGDPSPATHRRTSALPRPGACDTVRVPRLPSPGASEFSSPS